MTDYYRGPIGRCGDCQWWTPPHPPPEINREQLIATASYWIRHDGQCHLKPQEVPKATTNFCSHWTQAKPIDHKEPS